MRRLFWLLVVLTLFVAPFSFADTEDQKARGALREWKMQVFKNFMKDPNIRELSRKVAANPADSALMDNLLIRMPLSPMDMFVLRMESRFREYIVPKETMGLHKRWLAFHPEVQIEQTGAIEAVSMAFAPFAPEALAASVGSNRNAAATYNPAPENYDGEIQLAVNKNNTQQLVASANTWNSSCDTLSIVSTTNGGTSWRYACAPVQSAYGISCPANNIPLGSDPAVFWDNSSNVFLNYMLLCCNSSCQAGTANPTSSLVTARSTDSGLTWSGHGVIVNNLSSTSLGFDDKQFYAVDNTPSSPYYGRHYQCWDNNNNGLFAYSTNGSSTWTKIDTPKGTTGDLELGCEMAVQSNGTVHMIFDGLVCGATCSAEKTYYMRSTNGGSNWSTPVLVKSHNVISFHNNAKVPVQDERGINPFGAIDVDNSGGTYNGRLYVVYSDSTSTSAMASADIFVKYSTDNGATWSSEVKVNDDGTSTIQFHPFLMVDQTNGAVVVGWHDARNDTAGNKRVDYYMSRSTNGGLSWEANIKVSQPSSEFTNNTGISYSDESSNNASNNPNQYGEYLGLDAHNGIAYMAWTDTRGYFPTGTTNSQKENIGFAAVAFTASGDTTAPTTSLTAPANGATVSGNVTVSANASDNVGVTNVEFYRGTSLIGSDATSPYSITWDSTGVANGTYSLTSRAYDAAGNNASSTAVSVTVNNVGGPPALTATYNTTYKAPACVSGGKSCDSGASLLNGRATLGPEPNYPNTVNSACTDGTSGTYHSDESNDRLMVATNDGTALAGGKTVTVSATVWCWGTADALDLYYTSSIPGTGSPTWTLIRTQNCTVSGQAATLTGTYTLPSTGATHAVRANFRYQGSAGSCTTGSYDDHDDLVFGVQQASDTTAPTTSITSPANGATVSGTVTISANASDNVGVTNVEFYRGTTLMGSDNTAPYSYSWNTTGLTNGSYTLTTKAYDAANNIGTSTGVTVNVNNVTVPDLTATYNSTYKAPACAAGGKSCDTGASLINGRGTMTNGNETNRPNTINSSCVDGNSGTYHSDESIDRMKVATNDGSALSVGDAVTVSVTVWCYSSADRLDLYRTATIPGTGSPSWTLIGTQQCSAAGVRTFTATYTLPTGTTQAVRGNFRYNGTAGTCSTGSYNDRDDLVFSVQ